MVVAKIAQCALRNPPTLLMLRGDLSPAPQVVDHRSHDQRDHRGLRRLCRLPGQEEWRSCSGQAAMTHLTAQPELASARTNRRRPMQEKGLPIARRAPVISYTAQN